MSSDARPEIYKDLQAQQRKADDNNRYAARRVLEILWEYIQPKSTLDVGCGLGTWLDVARSMGAADIRGVEGPWMDAQCGFRRKFQNLFHRGGSIGPRRSSGRGLVFAGKGGDCGIGQLSWEPAIRRRRGIGRGRR